jgi:hypothetical protein
LKSNPDHERAGTVYASLLGITRSSYDIRRAKHWYTAHKEHEHASDVIASWLNVAYWRSIEHWYAIDAAKDLLKSDKKRAELSKLVGILVSVEADEQTIGWAKEAYENTGHLWILIRLLKHAPDPSLIVKAEELSDQWIDSEDEEQILHALLKADPGNEFAKTQAALYVKRHPDNVFYLCNFCGKTNYEVEFLFRGEGVYICSTCVLCLKDRPHAADTGDPSHCSFCHDSQSKLYGNLEHKMCRGCLDLCEQGTREEEIGRKFLEAARNANATEFLPDSIISEDLIECSFCMELKTTCCTLFTGSQSQICNECYDTYVEERDSSTKKPCARCQSKKTHIACVGFTLCDCCINALNQQENYEKTETNSGITQSPCSMCNLDAMAVQFGDFRLCATCAARVKAVLDEPAPNPKVGQHVLCRISKAEPGGYRVTVGISSSGFLATRAKLKRGLKLSVQFFCWYRGRMMLKPRPSFRGQ